MTDFVEIARVKRLTSNLRILADIHRSDDEHEILSTLQGIPGQAVALRDLVSWRKAVTYAHVKLGHVQQELTWAYSRAVELLSEEGSENISDHLERTVSDLNDGTVEVPLFGSTASDGPDLDTVVDLRARLATLLRVLTVKTMALQGLTRAIESFTQRVVEARGWYPHDR